MSYCYRMTTALGNGSVGEGMDWFGLVLPSRLLCIMRLPLRFLLAISTQLLNGCRCLGYALYPVDYATFYRGISSVDSSDLLKALNQSEREELRRLALLRGGSLAANHCIRRHCSSYLSREAECACASCRHLDTLRRRTPRRGRNCRSRQ